MSLGMGRLNEQEFLPGLGAVFHHDTECSVIVRIDHVLRSDGHL